VLYLSRRFLHRLQPGDLAAFWAIWYGLTRTGLETFREGWNWTLGGIPTAMLVGVTLAMIGVAWIAWNHRPGNAPYEYPEPYRPPEYEPPTSEPPSEADPTD
jgi:prolipoprotein diacylglyceryltransferase